MNQKCYETAVDEVMATNAPQTLCGLLRRFIPLAATDLAMALGDPLRTIAVSRLGDPQVALAAVGAVKSIAVFLESPVIMILQCSTVLSRNPSSFQSLRKLTLVLSILLTLIFAAFAFEPLYALLATTLMGLDADLATKARVPLMLLLLWPAVIAWRRLYQGKLIQQRRERWVAAGGSIRLGFVVLILTIGVRNEWDGAVLASLSMIGSVAIEALVVVAVGLWPQDSSLRTLQRREAPQSRSRSRKRSKASSSSVPETDADGLPSTFGQVCRYYAPLASTMVVVWGGKALLVALVARADDAALALAAWTAVWGFIVTFANGTRMIQQVLLASSPSVSTRLVGSFVLVVGLIFCIPILALGFSELGRSALHLLFSDQPRLVHALIWPIRIGSIYPLLLAIHAASQSVAIRNGSTKSINHAAIVGVGVMLATTGLFIRSGHSGAVAAAVGIVLGQILETLALLALHARAY